MRCFFLTEEREQLFHTIDDRCLAMLHGGLLEEVADLLAAGRLPVDFVGSKSIGYRQTIQYLVQDRAHGDTAAFTAFLAEFASRTRNYARKQLQWYRRDPAFLWVRVQRRGASSDPYAAIAEEIGHWIAQSREEFDAAIAQQMADKAVSSKELKAALARQTSSKHTARDVLIRRAEDGKTTKMKRYTMDVDGNFDSLVARADACSERLRRDSPALVEQYARQFASGSAGADGDEGEA